MANTGNSVVREDSRAIFLREHCQRLHRLHGIGIATIGIVEASQNMRAEFGFNAARLASRKQLHAVPGSGQVMRLSLGKNTLFTGLDGLKRAALTKLDVIAEIKLQGFEDFQAASVEH